jgi:F-type H+-transporting ATPase subunit delta
MFLNTKIVKTYSASLFSQAYKNKKEKDVFKDIKLLNIIMKKSVPVKEVMLSPVVSKTDKIRLVDIIAGENKFQELSKRFFFVLIKNARVNILPNIIEEFELLQNESNNIKSVEVYAAGKLDKEEIKYIISKIESRLPAKIEIKSKIDQSLLGGVVIKYDNNLIDYSVKGALHKMHKMAIG